ncbi:MAG: hypothetical protein P1P85_01585 [Patescibacteria group bacterium]|nr:hypothetical protein [Patescibacteria group bacterium]
MNDKIEKVNQTKKKIASVLGINVEDLPKDITDSIDHFYRRDRGGSC